MFLSNIIKFIKTNVFFLMVLTITIFVIYGKSISFDYTDFDDKTLIPQNINFISNIKNIPKLFTTSCFYSDDYSYYRPILSLSFMMEAKLFGDKIKIYHLTNIIIFILSIYLMYVFLCKLKLNNTISKFVLLLVAVHPILISVILWIPARNDILLMIFLMLSFINFINYLEQNRTKFLILYCLFFAIALFTKETTLVLIPIYFLFIYCFNFKIIKKQIMSILIILFPIIMIYFILRSIAVVHIDLKEYFLNWHQYTSNALTGTIIYVDKFIMPEYIPIMLYKIKLSLKTVTINAAILSLLYVLYYKKIISRKVIVFAIIWFVSCLLPTFFLNDYLFLLHRLFVPMVSIIIILIEVITNIIGKYPITKKYLIGLFVILFVTYSYAAYTQKDKYKNSDTFWTNAYLDAPNYYLACNGLAVRYNYYGDFEKAQKLAQKAFICEKKYSNKSGFRSLLTLSEILLTKGDIEQAEAICLDIANIKFDTPSNLRNLSEIYLIKKDMPKSIKYAQNLWALYPYNPSYGKHLANIYKINKEFSKAIEIYTYLLKQDKYNDFYYYNLSLIYESMNDISQATEYIKEAIKLNKENSEYKEQLQKLNK